MLNCLGLTRLPDLVLLHHALEDVLTGIVDSSSLPCFFLNSNCLKFEATLVKVEEKRPVWLFPQFYCYLSRFFMSRSCFLPCGSACESAVSVRCSRDLWRNFLKEDFHGHDSANCSLMPCQHCCKAGCTRDGQALIFNGPCVCCAGCKSSASGHQSKQPAPQSLQAKAIASLSFDIGWHAGGGSLLWHAQGHGPSD